MSVPTPKEIRDMLEGYGLDTSVTTPLAGTLNIGSAVVTNVDTTSLQGAMEVSGVGIPAYATILSIDVVAVAGQLTLDVNASANGSQALTFKDYPVLTNAWLKDRRDNFVIPWIENKTGKTFSQLTTTTEYYSGTGSSILVLRNRPIVQIIKMGYTNVDTNFYYLSPTAVVIIAEEGILKAKANFNESSYIPIFYKGERNIAITYTYGYATMPADVAEAVKALTCERALGHVGSKTGGGDLSGEGYSRSFGGRGKWTHVRNDLAREGISLLRKYMSGATST